jgi:hypothetical protein
VITDSYGNENRRKSITNSTSTCKKSDSQGWAITAFIIGIINLCIWILPFCGGPLSIVGIVIGVLGLKSSQRILAIIGLVLSVFGLLATIANSVLWVILYFGGQYHYLTP